MRRAYVNLKLLEHKVINFELKSTVLGTVDQLHPIGMPFNLPPITYKCYYRVCVED